MSAVDAWEDQVGGNDLDVHHHVVMTEQALMLDRMMMPTIQQSAVDTRTGIIQFASKQQIWVPCKLS